MSRGEGPGETFLGRWSRLKQQGEEVDTDAPQPSPEHPAPGHVADGRPDDRTDDEILAELGLPHPDNLQPGDDISAFMSKAVPARLRRLALRQLWRGNPVLANVDGLVEYGEDYTDSALVVENLQTLYQVGKGMFVKPEEPEEADEDALAAAGEAEEDDADAPASDAPPPDELTKADDSENATVLVSSEVPAMDVSVSSDALDPQPLAARRRMRFT